MNGGLVVFGLGLSIGFAAGCIAGAVVIASQLGRVFDSFRTGLALDVAAQVNKIHAHRELEVTK